jgi:arylformamidase
MKIIDISWPISENMTGYKDKPACTIEQVKKIATEQVRESRICLSSHAGTHVDAPSHFLQSGVSIDSLELKKLIGPCKVIDMMHINESIGYQDLKELGISAGDIVLFKTKNSNYSPTDQFQYNFVYLNQSGAQYLGDCGVTSVGIDYLGIERNQSEHTTHTLLLSKGIPIIEGLRLAYVAAGSYDLYCLPLYLIGAEAAPARAILVQKHH